MHTPNPALEQFDAHRERLLAIARRMLGSNADAEDAVQDVWLRVQRSSTDAVDNVAAWLTTVTARVCLNVLRSRKVRDAEGLDPFEGTVYVDTADPAAETALVDSVGIAVQVVLDTLAPAERLAFVLHDLFGMQFDEIAIMLERTPAATRQLASRARRQVRAGESDGRSLRGREHRAVINAFFTAARGGDLDGLIAVLAPDVVLRSGGGRTRPAATAVVHGAAAVAGRAMHFSQPSAELTPVVVRGLAGMLTRIDGAPLSLMLFTVDGDRIVAIDALSDPDRLALLRVVSP